MPVLPAWAQIDIAGRRGIGVRVHAQSASKPSSGGKRQSVQACLRYHVIDTFPVGYVHTNPLYAFECRQGDFASHVQFGPNVIVMFLTSVTRLECNGSKLLLCLL